MPRWTLARGRSWGIWRPITQPASIGALSILRAAIDPEAHGGEYYGPDGRSEYKGLPKRLESSPASHDQELQRQLWDASEQLTRITFNPSGADSLATPD
jgi:hypothetical protein